MSKFQDGFFQDLWCDMVLREADSIYCRFLLEEKKEQAYLAEHEEKKEKMTQKQSEKKSGTRARKVSKEHACVEILRVCQRRKKQNQISEAEVFRIVKNENRRSESESEAEKMCPRSVGTI